MLVINNLADPKNFDCQMNTCNESRLYRTPFSLRLAFAHISNLNEFPQATCVLLGYSRSGKKNVFFFQSQSSLTKGLVVRAASNGSGFVY